jgi:Putative lumazine-binding
MKPNLPITAAFLALAAFSQPAAAQTVAPQASTISPEVRAAVSVPLETYIRAQATGDGRLLMTAFRNDAMLQGADASGTIKLSAAQYARGFNGRPADDEAQRTRSFEILSVVNDAAIAVVVLDYPRVKYTDYMSLLKINGEWKIVNKTFFAQRR